VNNMLRVQVFKTSENLKSEALHVTLSDLLLGMDDG
jgi:hypothetical protein